MDRPPARTVRWSLAIAAVAAAAVAAPAAMPAEAILERGGSTQLSLDRSTAGVLARNGVAVTPIGNARRNGARLVFPVTGGQVARLATGLGEYRHSGGVQFRQGRQRLRLTDLTVKIEAGRARVFASIGAKRVPVFNLATGPGRVTFSGGRTLRIIGVPATLTPQGSAAINRMVGDALVIPGLRMGVVSLTARAYTTSVSLDPVLAAALSATGITVRPIAPAGAGPGGRIVLPVSSGEAALAPELAGVIGHRGGIALVRGATEVRLTNLAIDVAASRGPSVTAVVGGQRIQVLTVGLPASGARAGVLPLATLTGASLTFTAPAAALVNTTLGLGAILTATTRFGTADMRFPSIPVAD